MPQLLPEEIRSQDQSLERESQEIIPYGAIDREWDLAIHLIDEYDEDDDYFDAERTPHDCYPERPPMPRCGSYFDPDTFTWRKR